MKKKLPYFITLSLLSLGALNAQNYQHLAVSSGFNADVIANGVGAASLSTSIAVDNDSFAFMSNDFQATAAATPPAYALPATGLINSLATTGLSFQLAPLTGNNSLRIGIQNTSGTIVFSNAVYASKIYILATSGSGAVTTTITITFNDNTTQVVTGSVVPDWFSSNALPITASGFGRLNRLTNQIENPFGNPRLYQLLINISAANQTKTISSIQFTKTSVAEGVLNVFAVTADALEPPCTAPDSPTAPAQSFCSGATVAELEADGVEGATFKWYSLPSGGTQLLATANLSTGTYYVSQTVDGCESPRTMVAITVTSIGLPLANSQTFCSGDTVAQLTAEGEAEAVLSWSLTDGGEPLDDETLLASGTYYVSQMLGECQSGTVSVDVTVNSAPVVLTDAEHEFCDGATINDIQAEGVEEGIITWSLTAGGDALDMETLLETGNYYVHQNLDGCDSEVTTIMVTIHPIPLAPEGDDSQLFTEGETLETLDITVAEGAQLNWYTMDSEGNYTSISAETELEDGATYYCTQTLNGCESDYYAVTTTKEVMSTGHITRNSYTAYPNPVADILTVSAREPISDLIVLNLLGQKVAQQKGDGKILDINLSGLPQGSYIIQLNTHSGSTATLKVIKQ